MFECSHSYLWRVSRRFVTLPLLSIPWELTLYTGIGLFFSAFMITLTAIQARYTAFSPKNSEEFSSASRSVKPGLIASGIVSAWTWAATLVRPHSHTQRSTDILHCLQLQSSAVAYKYGISGPWWYGAGATVQVLLFAQVCTDQNALHAYILTSSNQLAAKLKLNAPYAHTWLEIVHARWGRTAHLVFMFFGSAAFILSYLITNLGDSGWQQISSFRPC